ncbi:MAG: hypothetical protein H7Y06_00605 [Opitutaceae bacterium]|nr:hypothetical protein [Opitutaceae bacterium]
MHSPLHHETPASKWARLVVGLRLGAFMWAVTFLLLAFVSAIYAFVGTDGESGGLFGRIAMAGFAMLALVMFFIRRVA